MNFTNISIRDLGGFICEKLRTEGIDVTLVGGGCVTIYSENRYQSYDLDFVTYESMKRTTRVLESLGFIKKSGYFTRPDCKWIIEFVAPPIAIGKEPIHKLKQLHTKHGMLQLLLPTDCVKDRLASFFHWDDPQSIEQAIEVCHSQKVDLKEIELWAKGEGQSKKFNEFIQKYSVKNS